VSLWYAFDFEKEHTKKYNGFALLKSEN
jgi:hypothetical protein